MLRDQLGPSFEFIVNARVVLGPCDACQRCAFGKACLREVTCALGSCVYGRYFLLMPHFGEDRIP